MDAAEAREPRVAVIGFIRLAPEKLSELRPHLKAVVEATRANDGCLMYDATEDPFEPGVIRFTELWPDQASLDRHSRAPHLGPWRAAVGALGVLERRFMIYDIAGSRPL